jgi:hypothetical protein
MGGNIKLVLKEIEWVAEDTDQWRAVMSMVMTPQAP